MLRKKDIMTMHLIIEVRGKYRKSSIMKKDTFTILFERFDASHIHGIFVVTKVQRINAVCVDRT
jgi:hypothetical protein